MDMTPA
jgi:hypothetical protein